MQIIHPQLPTGELNGRRKAVLIGVNYTAFPAGFSLEETKQAYGEIFGSHLDVQCMASFLTGHQGWPSESILIMTDDPLTVPHLQPTRVNILRELAKLAEESQPGDQLFLQFSGHGDQIPDEDFDEVDGMDEVIISSDAKIITDDEMHEVLIRKIPAGCHMSVVFDCCSSGTALDLPVFPDQSIFLDSPVGFVESPQIMPATPSPQSVCSPTGISRAARKYYGVDPLEIEIANDRTLPSPTGISRAAINFTYEPIPEEEDSQTIEMAGDPLTGRPAPPSVIRTTGFRPPIRKKYSSGDVVMWSSCRDGEDSGEVKLIGDNRSRGAMTHAFIESMTSNEYKAEPTYHNLLNCIRYRIQSYDLPRPQHVQLSSSHDINPEKWYKV